jgi:hypothetical protein
MTLSGIYRGFITFPDKVATKKATLLVAFVVTLSGLEPIRQTAESL